MCCCRSHTFFWRQIWEVLAPCYSDCKDQAVFLERFSKCIIIIIAYENIWWELASHCIINLSRKVKAVGYFHQAFGCRENCSTPAFNIDRCWAVLTNCGRFWIIRSDSISTFSSKWFLQKALFPWVNTYSSHNAERALIYQFIGAGVMSWSCKWYSDFQIDSCCCWEKVPSHEKAYFKNS